MWVPKGVEIAYPTLRKPEGWGTHVLLSAKWVRRPPKVPGWFFS
jgi:hypothetical protein